ncbi:hypothetical protein [Mesorhizobium sp. ANAO-SY3R2]|uniref:hypothetical protein n=1 Tax=Mesorhizobium sp. ANAO-SY3R2 TaxID=3166644 RepID=UPI0036700233
MTAVNEPEIQLFRPIGQALPGDARVHRIPATAAVVSLLCLAAAAAVWLYSLPRIDPDALDDFGLISILPPSIWVAYALVAIGFTLSLRRDLATTPLPLAHVVMLVLLLHGTPAIAYETLRYAWAWKHVGIVDYAQRYGELDAATPFLAIYENWPGFFLASAWVANLFHLRPLDVAEFARFAPFAFNLLYVLVLQFIFRQLTADWRLIWAAIWFFVLGNWIGQDYFSPQGLSYLFYLCVIAICLGPLRISAGWLRYAGPGLLGSFCRAISALSGGQPPAMQDVSRPWRMFWAAATLLLIVATTAIHPLTPMALILALAGLAFVGQLSVGYFLFAFFVEAAWLTYFASSYLAGVLPDVVRQFGNTTGDIRLVDTSTVSYGQMMVSFASRSLTAAIAAMALWGGVRRLVAGYRDSTAAVLTLAPAFLLVATAYGGEIVFRVYLFALPFLAFFAAALFYPAPWNDRDLWRRGLIGAIGILFACGFVMANNGKDRQYRFTPAEVEAADWLYRNAPKGALIVEGSNNYPYQFRSYENFTFVTISDEAKPSVAAILAEPAGELGRWLQGSPTGAGFVIITRSQKAYVDDLGVMPRGALTAVEAALAASPHFRLVHATVDAKIFSTNGQAGVVGNWVK